MTRFARRLGLPAAVAVLALLLLPDVGRAQTPLYFPRSARIDTTAFTMRVSGDHRFATAGALARVSAQNQSTNTGYPFSSPNATADVTAYGFSACPKAVGIAAGDTVADALAASAMKDLGLLTIGGQSIDTTNAVMLLTTSGRQGATDLHADTLNTLGDLRDACGTFDAVVFGSEFAVPNGAVNALDAIASRAVRVAGTDRFDTARAIAVAVHSAKGPANVDYFASANTPTPMQNTVILAEAMTGADALAVGPFAASRNVPIVLTSGPTLPSATRNALLAIRPANILVLGGTAAISDDVMKQATDASGSGAKATRIAGADRYETSVKIQQTLYNKYPITTSPIPGSAPSAEYNNVVVGFARSEGSGPGHIGFPDALASAWFLDTQADQSTPPRRMAVPIEMNNDTRAQDGSLTFTTIGGTAGSRRASLLLVPANAVPATVSAQLRAMYPAAARNTTTAGAKTSANQAGFGFIFGGESAITQTNVLSLATLLAGGFYTTPAHRSDLATRLDPSKVFFTELGYTGYTSSEGGGVDAEGAVAPGEKVCMLRDAAGGAQFLAMYQVGGFAAAGIVDYQDTAGSWPQFQSRFVCFDATNVSSNRGQVLAIGPTGHDSSSRALDWSASDARLLIDPPIAVDKASTITNGSALLSEQSSPLGGGGSATATATWSGVGNVVFRGTRYNGAEVAVTITFTRHDPNIGMPGQFPGSAANDYVTYSGSMSVRSGSTLLLSGNLAGESATAATPFKLVGMYNTAQGNGGMRATVEAPDANNMRLTDFVLDGTG